MAKRRANGEGNIRKRKDGRWEGRYTAGFDPDTGKRITRNVLGKTQTEVKQKLKEAIQITENLDIKKYEQYTVGQWAQVWFEVYAKPNIRESTALYYWRCRKRIRCLLEQYETDAKSIQRNLIKL